MFFYIQNKCDGLVWIEIVGAPMESWDHSLIHCHSVGEFSAIKVLRLPPSQLLQSGVREVKIDPPRVPTTVENWSQAGHESCP